MAKQPVSVQNPNENNNELFVKLSEIKSNNIEFESFTQKTNSSLYQMLAKIVGFVNLTRTEEGQQIFTDMCKDFGISPKDNADIARNEFLPHFRLIFQKSPKDKLSSSLYKWCQSVRYLVEHNVSEKDVVEFIETFKWENKSKILALVSADSNNHPTGRGRYPTSIEDKLYKLMRQTEDKELTVFDVNETPPTVEKLCLVLGEVDKHGKVILRKFYDKEDLPSMLVKFLPKRVHSSSK